MKLRHSLILVSGVITLLSCSQAPAGSPPEARPAAAPAATPGQPQVAQRRVPPSRDSLARLRAVYVAQVMGQIAGRENEPAEKVFRNVQVLKGITAAELVQVMDKNYATAMSWNCTNCHRLAPQGNFSSDTSADKKRARFMQQMQNDINLVQLPKLYPKDTPRVDCATCHRGFNEPLPPQFLVPERGKPGGPPAPPPRGAAGL